MGAIRTSNWFKVEHLKQKSKDMEILKAASDWAKSEIVSSIFFMLFGIAYLLAAFGFWQWGNSPLTKALVIPILIAGGLLLSAGISFYISNKSRLTSFETSYKTNPSALIESEIERTTQTIRTYENVALKVFPAVIVVAALLSIFISNPIIRAICIAMIAFLSVLVILDSQALKRIKIFNQQLELVEQDLKN